MLRNDRKSRTDSFTNFYHSCPLPTVSFDNKLIFFLLTKSGDLLFNLLETSSLNNATNCKTFIFKKLVKIVSYMTKLYFKISISILKVIEAFTLTDCIFLS